VSATVEVLLAALAYAKQRGWPVFPCGPDKQPLTAHGFKDASTDEAQIHSWWQDYPTAAIGVDCGRAGIVVVDQDIKEKHNGRAAWRALGIDDTTALHTRTPSGGEHAIFSDTTNGAIHNSASKLADGIDIRAKGGYVLLPGSKVATGSYEAIGDWEREPGPLPKALVILLTNPTPERRPPSGAPSGNGHSAYTQAALRDELARLAQAPDGQRNDQLNRSAYSLGQLIGADLLDRLSTESQLEDTAVSIGLDLREAQATIKSGLESGIAKPRQLQESFRPGPISNPHTPPGAPETIEGITPEHLTDVGNASRLVRMFGQDLRYVAALGWLAWDSKRWRKDDTNQVMRLAKKVALSFYDDAAQLMEKAKESIKIAEALAAQGDTEAAQRATAKAKESSTLAAKVSSWAGKSQMRQRLEAMIALAQSETSVVARVEDFDKDPMLLNVDNGEIDLRTGCLHSHRRESLCTKMSPVKYDPAAKLPLWEEYLATVTQAGEDLKAYLKRAAGYILTGLTIEEVIFLLLGPEASGKTTWIQALLTVMGDYGKKVSFDTFIQRKYVGGARPDLASIAGSRLTAGSEVDPSKRVDAQVAKEISGGDDITARHLYKEEFTFKPQCKVVLACNEAPRIPEDDAALWRRLRRLPFEYTIPEDRRDPNVKATLCNPEIAGPAILAWAVEGCVEWQEKGLGYPDLIRAKTTDLRQSMDPLREFFTECCVTVPLAQVPAGELRAAYDSWAKENGYRFTIGGKEWGERLRALGCQKRLGRTGGDKPHQVWYGIGLRTSLEENVTDVTDVTAISMTLNQTQKQFLMGEVLENEVTAVTSVTSPTSGKDSEIFEVPV
jgi:putative DNA primase/helicase